LTYSSDYRKAATFIYHQNDSAFYYFNKVVNNAKDSLIIAMSYNQMAAIQTDAGDYFGGQESLLLSLKYLNEQLARNRTCLASDYNELGMSSSRLENHEAAIDYYHTALLYIADTTFKAIIANNLAYSCQQKHDYMDALKIYESAVRSVTNETDLARVKSNIAFTKWLKQPAYNAAPELLKALNIRKANTDLWGENSSYDYLAEFYKRTKPDSALFYTNAMYVVARKLGSPDDELIALGRLIRIGKAEDAKRYFTIYQHLNDSTQIARNTSKYQFALIRYNAEKNKADNLKLEKDNSEAKYQILGQRIFIAVSVFLAIASTITLFFWLKKRKREQQRATLEAVADTQRNNAKKVHDTLANDVYYILKKVQSDDVPNKDWLVNHIDEVYERARDISRELTPGTDENFHEYISERLKAFATDTIQVLLVGNEKELWDKINPLCRNELKNILQELMVNMRKHSKATSVVIRFEDMGELCGIFYSDDGAGIVEKKRWGQGLKNTGNRIKMIGGVITFGGKVNEGMQITITFPFI